jgi:hypothetical protein
MLKVNWQDEELDIIYRKQGYPEKVWKDNEGMPYGIYYYSDNFTDINNWKITIAETWNMDIEDVEWFATEQERDQTFKINRGDRR